MSRTLISLRGGVKMSAVAKKKIQKVTKPLAKASLPSEQDIERVSQLRSQYVNDIDIARKFGLSQVQFLRRFGVKYRTGEPRNGSVVKWLKLAFTSSDVITPTELSVIMGKTKSAAHRVLTQAVTNGWAEANKRGESGYARYYELTPKGKREISPGD